MSVGGDHHEGCQGKRGRDRGAMGSGVHPHRARDAGALELGQRCHGGHEMPTTNSPAVNVGKIVGNGGQNDG